MDESGEMVLCSTLYAGCTCVFILSLVYGVDTVETVLGAREWSEPHLTINNRPLTSESKDLSS